MTRHECLVRFLYLKETAPLGTFSSRSQLLIHYLIGR